MASHPAQLLSSEPKTKVAQLNSKASSYSASDDEIPTIDYSQLFSDDIDQQFIALEYLRQACQEYGFFYLVNHTIPDRVIDNILKGLADFFAPTNLDERRTYRKMDPSDKIRWCQNYSSGENRENLKVIAHPEFYVPSKPSKLCNILEEYHKEMRAVVVGLASAVSKTLGFEENYIENAFNLKSGFDVMSMNLYPPNSRSKGAVGLSEHTDPGFVITLQQDVDGGFQILSHNGRWINAYIPHRAILIQLGDHLEILTNGKYKSHIHRVIVDNNKEQRITVVTPHGPSLNKFICPGKEFIDEEHPAKYRGMTYKESLEANGGDEIGVQSSLELIKLGK
ncbi:hypothetical protein RIF29_38911 [Crotalaria pallida]|uniref:Fe2OG dioxygenase domain-containing protein n=1 Tax=Crotalaria pallida TaxID=3830 RepID=A0AAN9E089_CROPI